MFEQESLQNESMEKYIWNQPLEHPKMVSTKWENTTPFFRTNPAQHKMMVYAGHVPTHFMPEISRGILFVLSALHPLASPLAAWQQTTIVDPKKQLHIHVFLSSASLTNSGSPGQVLRSLRHLSWQPVLTRSFWSTAQYRFQVLKTWTGDMGHTLHWDVAMFLAIFGNWRSGGPPVGPMSLGRHLIFGGTLSDEHWRRSDDAGWYGRTLLLHF